MSTIIPSVITSLVINIMNQIYAQIAMYLTNFENHKSQTVYEKSLIMKTWTFSFLNNFLMLLYIAFIKWNIDGCLDTDENGVYTLNQNNLCANELAIQIWTILIINFIKNLNELGQPLIIMCLKWWGTSKIQNKTLHTSNDRVLLARIEEQASMTNYAFKEIDGTYWDYLEMMH